MEELIKSQAEVGPITPEVSGDVRVEAQSLPEMRTDAEIQAVQAEEAAATNGLQVTLETLPDQKEQFPEPVVGQTAAINPKNAVDLITLQGGCMDGSALEDRVAVAEVTVAGDRFRPGLKASFWPQL